MNKNQLEKAYEAIELLESINMPVSQEQKSLLAEWEKEFLSDEVIPLMTQEILPIVEIIKNNFELEIIYSKEFGFNINIVNHASVLKASGDEKVARRQRTYIIRVLFPDNHVSCHNTVWETLVDVIRYAGAENVGRLGITVMGNNLISRTLFEDKSLRSRQKEVEPGYYVFTYSSTETKLEQIKKINNLLKLGLQVEKQML